MTTRTWKPVRLSALHHSHVELGAAMVEREGWEQPSRYSPVERELATLRENVGLCDVSAGGKLLLQGDGLGRLLDEVLGRPGVPQVGRVRMSVLSGDSSQEQVVVLRLAEDEAMMLTGVNRATAVLAILTDSAEGCSHVSDVTSAYSAVRIAGPNSATLLAGLTALDVGHEAFPDLACAQVKLAEVHGLLMRGDRAGLRSYELLFGLEYGVYVWEALLETAREYGGSPVGFQAMDQLLSAV